MSADTENKRASLLGIGAPGRTVYPVPDGSLANAQDREQSAGLYALGAAPSGPTPTVLRRSITGLPALRRS